MNTTLATFVQGTIAVIISLAVVLGLFEIIPMESVKPNHDLAIIVFGLMIGALSLGYMEHVSMFVKK